MPDININIEIYCSCGNGLCNQTSSGSTKGRGQEYFTVEPCDKCLEFAKENGYSKGYKDAENNLEVKE